MSPAAVTTAAFCPETAAARTQSTRSRKHLLTDGEIEILVRLVGYGCPPEKAARYLERSAAVIGRELARLGLASPGPENVETPAALRR